MYTITLDTEGQQIIIHSPYVNNLKVLSGTLKLGLNQIDEFTFVLHPANPGYGMLRPLVTLVSVWDVYHEREIYEGRVLRVTNQMDDDGMYSSEIVCESLLGYLQDSCQRHEEIHNTTVRDFFARIIANHNKVVVPHKQFAVGEVTVTNTTDNVYRYLGYDKTFDTLKDKLISRLGGFLVLRKCDGVRYLDYLASVGSWSDTEIRVGRNLQQVSKTVDPSQTITKLVPLGQTIESDNPGDTDASQARLTIASVNGGHEYLKDQDMIYEFGLIEGTVIWDDVTNASILKSKGEEFLRTQKAVTASYEVTASDLSLIGLEVNDFRVGNWHHVANPSIGIDGGLQIVEQTIDVVNPTQASLVIGDKLKTLSHYQAETQFANRGMTGLRSQLDRQAESVSRIGSDATELRTDVDQLQQTVAGQIWPEVEEIKSTIAKDKSDQAAINADIIARLEALEGDSNGRY